MIVKKSEILEGIHEELPDIETDDIERVFNFFWKEGVYKDVTDLVYPRIHVKNLGTFVFVKSKIERLKYLMENFPRKDTDFVKERIVEFEQIYNQEYEKRNKKRELKIKAREDMEKKVQDS